MIRPKFNRAQIVGRAIQRWRPASGVEQSQGNPYYNLPGVQDQFNIPADPGISYKGWLNPFRSATYLVALSTTNPVLALPGNMRRTYLLVQNLGPGNVWINFGTDAAVNTCHYLVATQFYEQIGGGSFDYDRERSVANSFVTRDYVSMIADAASTFAVVTEGLWNFTPEEVTKAPRMLQE